MPKEPDANRRGAAGFTDAASRDLMHRERIAKEHTVLLHALASDVVAESEPQSQPRRPKPPSRATGDAGGADDDARSVASSRRSSASSAALRAENDRLRARVAALEGAGGGGDDDARSVASSRRSGSSVSSRATSSVVSSAQASSSSAVMRKMRNLEAQLEAERGNREKLERELILKTQKVVTIKE